MGWYMSPEYAEYQAKRSRAERARERAARMIGVTDLPPAPELEDLIDDAEEMCARVGATLDAPAIAAIIMAWRVGYPGEWLWLQRYVAREGRK